MADSLDSAILQEEIDEGYEPTEEEIMEFASWLGLDLPQHNTLLWIAREGLKAPLPGQWKPCRTEEDEIYYFNFDTGESSWNHPCDEFYRTLFKEEAQKRQLQQQQRQAIPFLEGVEQRKDTANLPQRCPNEMRSADQLTLSRNLEPVADDFIGMAAPKPSQVVSPKSRIGTFGEWGESEIRSPSTPGVPNPKTELSQGELKGTGQEGDTNTQPAPNGQKLVIKWKAAMKGETSITSQAQEKPYKEEKRKLQHGNDGGSPVTHPLCEDERVETEQRRDQMRDRVKLKLSDEERIQEREEILKSANEVVQKEKRDMYKSMQAEMLEQIKRELEEGDSLVEQRRKEIIEEVERQIEAEKKRLQEIQKKQLQKDLEHEQEMLQRREEERKHVWAAKLKQDEEEETRMNAHLEARRKKRDEDLAVLLEAETKTFEAQSLKRLESFRRNLEEEETKLMQSESEQMLSRVCDRQQTDDSAFVEEMKQEMLARMKQMVIALEKSVFERELETARQRVREKAESERKSLLARLEREVEAEVASLKEELLKEKREQMLQQVHEKIAEEQRLELEKIQRNSPGKEKRVAENTRRLSSEATRMQTPQEMLPFRTENEESVNCDLVDVLQKAACEVLMSLVVRNRADNEKKGCCSCDDRYEDLKHSMSHFEEEVKLMISSIRDETKEALASLKIEGAREGR